LSTKELKTERLQIPLTVPQMEQIEKLSRGEVLSAATFARQQLVKTLKLK